MTSSMEPTNSVDEIQNLSFEEMSACSAGYKFVPAAIAFRAGWRVGTYIYNQYSTQIGNGIEYFFPL